MLPSNITYRQHKLPTKFGAVWGFRLIPYASPLCNGTPNNEPTLARSFISFEVLKMKQKNVTRWQARREYDRNMRAGLIPSRALQERRIVHDRNEKNPDSTDGEE